MEVRTPLKTQSRSVLTAIGVSILDQRFGTLHRREGLRRSECRNAPGKQKQTSGAIRHRLLESVVYDNCCRISGSLSLDEGAFCFTVQITTFLAG
jgi:hypothetical protein